MTQINKRGKLDLILLTSASGTLNHSILSRLPSDNTQDLPSGGSAGGGGGVNGATQRKSLPHLQLPSMNINIDERDMQMLAFQIFISSCGSKASPELLQTIRAQLEIGEGLGKDLTTVTQLATKNGIPTLSTVDSLVKLLQVVPPSAFQSFRSFVSWRSGIATIISKSLEHAAAHSWAPQQGGGGGGDAAGAPARSLLASLRGSLRRMDVREADDYEEAEYISAARGVEEATRRLAANISGGLTLPLGLSVQVAEMLLCGVFDSLDEGQFVPEAPELLGLLSSNVWPQLGISPQMNSALGMWVHFRQYMASKETSLLHAGVQLAQSASASAASASPADAAIKSKVLDALSAEASTALSDYHTSFSNMTEMKALLEFLRSIYSIQNNSSSSNFEGMLARCIKASVGAAFARRTAEVHKQVALEEDRTALLATETMALLHVEINKFVPTLRQYQPAAAAIAADTLHELYGAKLLTWLISVNSLTKSVAATIHASVDLESELMAEISAHGGGGATGASVQALPHPWGAVQRITPLLQNWAGQQVSNMYGWLDRIMAEEDWSPVVQQRGATSRSAVEVLKVMDDAVDTLFGMGLAVPASVVNALVDGMDAVLQKYCKISLASVGSADSLVPPAPPLTRFKKDLAESAEVEAMGGSSGIKSVTNKVGAALVTSWLPSLTPEQQTRILGTSYDTLVVRANSMYHVATKTADLEALVIEKWREAQAEESSADAASFRGSGFLNGAVAAAADSVDNLLKFITLKLVCGDLRSAIFKTLYAFHVEYSRIAPVLEEVDGALGMLCEMLEEGLAPRMAGHVCKTLAAAVLHVLLDGGPNRLFTLQDMPVLLEDFEHLRAMFFAEGAGLDPTAVGKLCLPLENALYTMSLDTKALITALKTTKKQPLKASAGSASEGVLDPETVLRVLCHRADYEASKFLKKDYKIPKKLPNVFSASVSRSFAALSFSHTSATKATKQGGIRRMEASP